MGMLLLATFFWGTSFILMKGLVVLQQDLVEASTWHLAALSLILRFGIAGLLLLFWNMRQLRKMTWLEFYEGAGLGVVGGLGLLFQMDGVNHTSASTAAFLTQCYCIFIPLLVACRKREWPSRTIALSTAMVLAGVAILSQFDFRKMEMGRGELEVIIASLFFTAQILWLERPLFAKNNPHNFTFVMFIVVAIIFIPVPLSTGGLAMSIAAYKSLPAIALIVFIAIFCTNIAYGLMNYWQPHVDATRAGLIYCSEPVFTSIFALFLPQWISIFASIDYSNETVTQQQFFGGGLIVAANIFILAQAARAAKRASKAIQNVQ
ncbi:MAG: DMT family transporter [Verrucomicrobia bacterium]|nr:DMT family transporter [Verrucomicrobiota bacterium]